MTSNVIEFPGRRPPAEGARMPPASPQHARAAGAISALLRGEFRDGAVARLARATGFAAVLLLAPSGAERDR